MNRLFFITILATACHHPQTEPTLNAPSTRSLRAVSVATPKEASELTPSFDETPLTLDGPLSIYSNTTEVEAIAGCGGILWVATRGGLEQYDAANRVRVKHYTTLDGLPTLFVRTVRVATDGTPYVMTEGHECRLQRTTERFACRSVARPPQGVPSAATERIEGVPITSRYFDERGREWLGTAGLGVWARQGRALFRITPAQQITSNHVVAIAETERATYFATFDRGLVRLENGVISPVPLGARLLNDVLSTPAGMFVATSDGLYSNVDGPSFRRDPRVTETTINDLAYDPKRGRLYVAAINSLWELPLDDSKRAPRALYVPGGSRSLQAVDVSNDGTVYLATEDRGVLRREGKRRFTGFDRLNGYPSSWATDVLALDSKHALFGSLRHGVYPVGTANDRAPLVTDPWVLFLGRSAQSPEEVFVGTQGGAWIQESGKLRSLPGLPNPCVHVMARLTSGLWVGTEGGVAKYR